MENKQFRRFLSLAMAVLMVISNIPVQAFATDGGVEPCAEHTYSITHITAEATCTSPGSQYLECSVCGATTDPEEIPVKAHSYVDGACSVCGAADPDYVAPEEPSTEAEEPSTEAPVAAVNDESGNTFETQYVTFKLYTYFGTLDGAVSGKHWYTSEDCMVKTIEVAVGDTLDLTKYVPTGTKREFRGWFMDPNAVDEYSKRDTFEVLEDHLASEAEGGIKFTAGWRSLPSDKPPVIEIPENLNTEEKAVAEALQENAATKNFVPTGVPEGAALEIKLTAVDTATNKLTFDIAPMENGSKVTGLAEEITFRLPIPSAVTEKYAKVFHNGELLKIVEIQGSGAAKYIEVSSKDFSEFVVEPTDSATVDTTIDTAEELQAALNKGGEVVLGGNISDHITGALSFNVPEGVTVTLDLNGYTISSISKEHWAIGVLENSGNLTIKDSKGGGQIKTDNKSGSAVRNNGNGDLVIEDGYFLGNSSILRWDGTVTIKGGTFGAKFDNYNGVTIMGGTFPNDVTAYVAEGYVCTKSGDNWIVTEAPDPVAMIGETEYTTLEAAVKAATNYQSITLLKDVTINETLVFENSGSTYYDGVELILNGHTVTAAEGVSPAVLVKSGYVRFSYDDYAGTVTGDGVIIQIGEPYDEDVDAKNPTVQLQRGEKAKFISEKDDAIVIHQGKLVTDSTGSTGVTVTSNGEGKSAIKTVAGYDGIDVSLAYYGKYTAPNGTGIYHGAGKLYIDQWNTVSGENALCVESGEVNIYGESTFTGTAGAALVLNKTSDLTITLGEQNEWYGHRYPTFNGTTAAIESKGEAVDPFIWCGKYLPVGSADAWMLSDYQADANGLVSMKPYVATANGTSYTSLEAAISAAGKGGTVTLAPASGDTVDCSGLTISQDVIIDFAGYYLNFGPNSTGVKIEEGAAVTLKNGYIRVSDYARIPSLVNNAGELTLDKMNLSALSDGATTDAMLLSSGTTTITNGSSIGAYTYGEENLKTCIKVTDGSLTIDATNGTNGFNGNIVKTGGELSIASGHFDESSREVVEAALVTGKIMNSDGNVVDRPYVASIGSQGYYTLQDAVNAAKDGDTIQLSAWNTIITETVVFDKPDTSITLMNYRGSRNEIKGAEGFEDALFLIKNGHLTVDTKHTASWGGSSYMYAAGDVFYVEGGKLTIQNSGNYQIYSTKNCGVYIRGGEVELNNVTLFAQGGYAAIQGNGTYAGNVTINNSAVYNDSDLAIYWPQNGTLTITGTSNIHGKTAIYAKQGTINISGGTIEGNGAKAAYSPNGNGASATGDALVLESCGYGDLNVTISGGTFKSKNASPVGVYAAEGYETETGFITGGTFNKELPDELVGADFICIADGSNWVVDDACTVTFVNGDSKTAVKVAEGAAVEAIDAPAKEGYTFSGWFAENAEAAFDFAAAITENISLYAKYTPNAHTITFSTDGGSPIDPMNVVYDQFVDLSEIVPTKDNHVFKGWKDSEGNVVNSVTVKGNVTLIAVWEETVYTVYFDNSEAQWEKVYAFYAVGEEFSFSNMGCAPMIKGENDLYSLEINYAEKAFDTIGFAGEMPTLFPSFALPEEYAGPFAIVDGKTYEYVPPMTIARLQAAIDAAAATSDTSDDVIVVNNVIPADGTAVLDLKGLTVELPGIMTVPGADLTVKNGTLVGTDAGYSVIDVRGGNLLLEDVTASGLRHAVHVAVGTATIKSGAYSASAASTYAIDVGDTQDTDIASVTIEGGSFSNILVHDGSSLSITGGTFDQDPSAYVAEGYEATEEDGTWTVAEIKPVAQVGETTYTSLAEAVEAANAIEGGATVTLLADATIDAVVKVTGNVTIDGADKTITWAEGHNGTLFNVAADASLTTKNLTIDGENEFTFYNDTTTVENGQNWYTRFVDVGEEDKAVNANVIVNAGNLTLGKGTKIQNVTIASDSDNGKTANTETGGFYLMYNDDLAIIKSNGGEVTIREADISHNAGLVLNAVNADTKIFLTSILYNMGCGNKGGIIIANGGTMEFQLTELHYNKAMARSATILGVISGAEVDFSESYIERNKHIGVGSNTAGAMVVLEGASRFAMYGGTIAHNVGGRAGAIASRWVGGDYGQHEDTSIVLNAGTITDNTASNNSWDGASIFLRSPATIGKGMKIDGGIVVNAAPGELAITGGTINGSLTVTDGLKAEITGGTFNYDPTAWVASGYRAVKSETEDIWTVSEWNYEIWNKADLLTFAEIGKSGDNMQGKVIKLMADVDFEWGEWYPFNFYGTFEGNDHTISNLTYIPNPDGRMGFFQSIGGSAKGLTLDGIKGTVPADGRFGGFARYLNSAVEDIHVKNIEVTTTDTLAWVGGFTTYSAGGSTTDCSVENLTVNAQAGADLIAGFITLTSNRQLYKNSDVKGFKVTINDTDSSGCGVGGFAAQTQTGWNNPKFEDCDISGIDVTATGLVDVGGFIAWPGAHTEYANNCTTEGKIDVTGATADNFAGGFFGDLGWNCDLGYMGHVVNNCSANVDIITKIAPAGGFVGSATNSNNNSMYATFNNCSASGDITCVAEGTAPIGGFAGNADRGVYNNCSATGTVTNNGTGATGGFIGEILETTPKYDGRYPAGTREYLVDVFTFDTCSGSAEPFIGKVAASKPASELINKASYVAQVGESYYATFDAALAAAKASEAKTMTLLVDVVFNEDTTLDLEGVTINGMLVNKANMTVKATNGGKIDGGDLVAIDNYGTLTIEGGTFTGAQAAIYNNELESGKATVTINGGEFTAPGDYCATIENRYGILTVNGGKITATNSGGYAIVDTCGVTTITNGEIACAQGTAVETYMGEITINDGEFTGKVIVENQGGKVEVKGGKLVSNTPEYYYGLTIANGGTTTLYGGTFERDYATAEGTSVKIADGYKSVANDDGTYTVKKDWNLEIHNVEDMLYFANEVNAGNTFAGKTIKLMADIDLYEENENGERVSFAPIGMDYSFEGTFEGNNHKISNLYQSGWAFGYEWGSYGSIGLFGKINGATIQNLTIEDAECFVEGGDVGGIAGSATGDCVFENITITDSTFATYNNGCGGLIGWAGAGDYTFKGVTVDDKTVIAGLWGSFDSSLGGIMGQLDEDATASFEDVNVACRIDAYNDVTASYKWYSYRMCGMLIGRVLKVQTINGTNYPDPAAAGVTIGNNVNVTFGDWANYTYLWNDSLSRGCQRVEAGYEYGGVDITAYPDSDISYIPFKALFGGPQSQSNGYYGLNEYAGVNVTFVAEAAIGETKYWSLADALAAAKDGETVKLLKDAEVCDEIIVAGKTVTLDLNEMSVTGLRVLPVIRITEDANVTVKNGNITNPDGYCFILGASDGSSAGNLTIESGKYHGATTVASVTKGELTITGGEFSADAYNGGYDFLLNCIDANYKDGTAKIVVKGGSFHGFDPANNAAEGANTNFVAPGYTSTEENGVYTVKPWDYVIRNVNDMMMFAEMVNAGETFAGKTVKLGAAIDLSGIEWSPIGGENVYFAGEFDGQSYTISNLTQTQGKRMGLFGLVEKAYIHDFTLENVNFTVNENDARVGAVAGNLQYWNVLEDVTIDGINVTVNGNDGLIGSVTGYVWKSQLGNVDVKNATYIVNGTGNVIGGHTAYGRAHVWDTNVTGNNEHWLEGTVQTIDGTEYVLQNYFVDCDVNGVTMALNGTGTEAGGFIGSDTYNNHSNYFVDCHVTGLDVTAAAGTSQTVGGFMAWNNGTTSAGTVKGFDGCSVSGSITGADGIYGGFVGQSGGRAHEYYNASADVDITCSGTAGGFVGATQQYFTHLQTFTNCTASGDVSGKIAGGFAGKTGLGGDGDNLNVTFVNNKATGKVFATEIAGGFIGMADTELPATNWSITEGAGSLVLNGNTASAKADVTGDATVGYLIGYLDGVANGDAKEGNTVKLTVENNVPDGSDIGTGNYHHINISDDTIIEDINVTIKSVTIDSVADLIAFGSAVTSKGTYKGAKVAANPEIEVILTADLDLAGSGFAPIGNGAANAFAGTFDGGNHTISNMTLTCDYYRGVGFFRSLGNGAVVKNVIFENANVNNGAASGANHFYGVVAGFSNNLTLENVDVKNSSVTCKYAGAVMVGCLEGATVIKDCDIENVALSTTSIRGAVYGILGNSANGHSASIENSSVNNVKFLVDDEYKSVKETLTYNEWADGTDYTNGSYVAQIGETKYATLSDAVAAAVDGDTITLIGDVVRAKDLVISKSVTLDLGGKSITTGEGDDVYPVIRIQGDANVTVKNGNITNDDYVFVLGASDGSSAGNLTIESGKYHGATTVASVTKGELTITGGEFSADAYNGGYDFLLNCIDANYKDGTAKIVVKGGRFYGFNPENNAAEGAGTSFLPMGYRASIYGAIDGVDVYDVVVLKATVEAGGITYYYPGVENVDNVQELTNYYFLMQKAMGWILGYDYEPVVTLYGDVEDDVVLGNTPSDDTTVTLPETVTWTVKTNGCNADKIVAADDYIKETADNGDIIVRKANFVAQVGETKYESLQDALNACTNGETVKLIADVVYDADDVVNAIGGATGFGDYPNPSIVYLGGTRVDGVNSPSTVNAVLDLNGHTITNNAEAYLFLFMDNAKVTIKDSGNGDGIIGNSNYPVIWVTGTETLVTVESGKFSTVNSEGLMWSTHGGDLVINGGEFSTSAADASLLIIRNSHDRRNSEYFISGKATVTVKGGSFKGFNPEKMLDDSTTPFTQFDAVAPNYKAIEDNGVYEVVDYIKWIKEQLLAGNDVKLEKDIVVDGSMIESIPASTNGNGKYPNYAIFTVIGDEVTFDLNGHTITYNGHKSFQWNGKTVNSCTVAHGIFYANAGADLTVEDSVGTGKVLVHGLASGAYVASNDTTFTITGGTWINDGCANCGGTNIFLYPLQGGELYITGGYFEQALDSTGESYLLVEHGGVYKNEVLDYAKTKIEISGGTFVGMNPEQAKYFYQTADNKLDMNQEPKNVCAEGFASVANGDGSYTVKPVVTVTFDNKIMVLGNELPKFTYTTNFTEIAEDGMMLIVGEPEVTVNGVGEYEITAEASIFMNSDYVVEVIPGTLTVVKAVASIGTTLYGSLQDAIDAAEANDTVKLLTDLNIAEVAVNTLGGKYNTLFRVAGKTITVDLNGKTISGTYSGDDMLVGVFSTEGNGHLTLTGKGIIDVTAGTTVYSLIVNYDATSTITVENGTFKADAVSDSLLYTGGNEGITVNGGTFTLGNLGKGPDGNGSPWIFNAKGQNTAHVLVNGGTYNADINHQYWAHEVELPNTKALKDNGDGTWTVVDAVAYVTEVAHGYNRDVGYATLAEAIAKAASGEPVHYIGKDYAEDVTIKQTAGKNIVIVGEEGNSFKGTITVDGGKRSTGAETLTIQNVNFVANKASQIFVEAKSGTYAHNITVDGCTFTGDDAKTAYGLKLPNSYNITVKNSTGTKLLDLAYSNKAVTGFTAENVTVTDSINGFYMSYVINASFKRLNVNASNIGVYVNNYNASSATFEDCTITAPNPVVLHQRNATKKYELTFNGTNTFTTEGAWLTVDGTDADFKVTLNDAGLDATKASGLVAKIGENGNVYYNRVTYAAVEAVADDTIYVIADAEEDTTFDKDLNLEVGENTLLGKITVADGAELTIMSGTFNDFTATPYVVYGKYAQDNGDTTWTVAEAVAVNVQTGKGYGDVAVALAEAKSGQTVQILKNAETFYAIVTPGVTLDLNGFELKATYVAASFVGANVIDSSDKNTGRLVVQADNLALYKDNAQMPINLGDGSFMFAEAAKINQLVMSDSLFASQIILNKVAMENLKTNTAHGLTYIVEIAWEGTNGPISQEFIYNADQFANVFGSYNSSTGKCNDAFSLTLTGDYRPENMTVRAKLVSDLGVVIAGEYLSW